MHVCGFVGGEREDSVCAGPSNTNGGKKIILVTKSLMKICGNSTKTRIGECVCECVCLLCTCCAARETNFVHWEFLNHARTRDDDISRSRLHT